MKKICPSKVFMFVCVFAAIFTFVVAEMFAFSSAEAASADHPAVLLRISTYDNSRHLNISGYDDKSAVVASELKNSQNENWRFDYVGTDSKGSFYKLTNMGTGRLLTPIGYNAAMVMIFTTR